LVYKTNFPAHARVPGARSTNPLESTRSRDFAVMKIPGNDVVSAAHGLPACIRAGGVERTLKAGQTLFRMGDVPAGLFEVVKGKVRLLRTDASGRETVLYSAGPGQVLSEASLFSPVYHCNAVASTQATVRAYPKALLLAELQRDPEAALAFMAMLAREIMSLRTRLELSNIHAARDRVRHYLALNAAHDGSAVVLPGTVKEWAADLGLTHEALYRTLAVMQHDGEIRRVGRKITLTPPV
jgi:CRP-like cAMP-binding protein